MTLSELNELYYLDQLIETEQARLSELREAADVRSPILSDMPRAPGARDRLGDLVLSIVDQEAEIEQSLLRCTRLRARLNTYTNTLPNARIKLIMIKHFLQQKTWQQVAAEIGGKETEYSVKNACYRYIRDRDDPPWMKGQVSFFDQEAETQKF